MIVGGRTHGLRDRGAPCLLACVTLSSSFTTSQTRSNSSQLKRHLGRDLCNITDRIESASLMTGPQGSFSGHLLLHTLLMAPAGSIGCCRRLAHCVGRVGRGRAGEVRCSSLFERQRGQRLCGRWPAGRVAADRGWPEALGGILHGSSLQTTSFQSVLHGATVPCGSGRHQLLASLLPQGGPDFAMHATPAGGTTAK